MDTYGESSWLTDKFNDAQEWLTETGGNIGRGLYDSMMGDDRPGAIPGSYGDLRSDMLGGIDPNDNVLRDSFGAAGELLGDALGRAGAAASSTVPGCAERLDYETMCDRNAHWLDRSLATASLGVSAITLGTSPNYSALRRAARWGPQHGGFAHWQRIQQIADAMKRNGWRDIRVNRQQYDAFGNVVGRNRPDISGINPRTGQRHNIEIDTKSSASAKHQTVVNANDPSARNTFILLP